MSGPDATERRTVVVTQSNYLPWKGYLDLMAAADTFVLFDEVQFTRRDWRNRNRVVAGGETRWLTIPVETKGGYETAIADIRIADGGWARKHWATLRHAYGRAPHFERYAATLEAAYGAAAGMDRLSDVNRHFLSVLAPLMGVDTPVRDSAEVARTTTDPTRRLVELTAGFGGTRYLSGPAAKAYLEPRRFEEAGIALAFADYGGYPSYDQGRGAFEHGVSVVDLLMRVGPEAATHLKSTRPDGLVAA